jgi:hypothetical protein
MECLGMRVDSQDGHHDGLTRHEQDDGAVREGGVTSSVPDELSHLPERSPGGVVDGWFFLGW